MGKWKRVLLLAGLIVGAPGIVRAQASVTTVDQAVERILAREHEQIAIFRKYSPIIETYLQEMKPDPEMGAVPARDHYFIGQADLDKGLVDRSMLAKRHSRGVKEKLNPLSHLGDLWSSSYVPEGFLQMIFLDTQGFDRQHYKFDYVRREFLGEVRCLMFDVEPLPHSGKGRFKGRLWAEDQNYTIVRFNGVYSHTATMNGEAVHFDSWRLNVAPGLWLPAYIFSQETDPHGFSGTHARFRGQTRLWGYDLKNVGHEEEFSELKVESRNTIRDQTTSAQDPSPLEAERAWQHQAEENVIDRLERVGLIAPPGEVDKVLETVVNNLEVTNNLDVQPEIHCRVLLTSGIESFTIGHTIVMSRGLLDVLPDEASLATMLAQELAGIMLLKTDMDRWGFNDETMVPTVEAMRHFSFEDSPQDLQQASQKAVELLKNSPYKDKLANAGLFLKQLNLEAKNLPALIDPKLGNRVVIADQIVSAAPQLEPAKLDQIAALPLGARIKLDPWSDRVELIKTKPTALLSPREKLPFEITPFMPYVTRYLAPASTAAPADATKASVAEKQQPDQPEQQPQPKPPEP